MLRQRGTAGTGDVEAFLALDEEFHRDLAGLARMPTLSVGAHPPTPAREVTKRIRSRMEPQAGSERQ